jgi:hypothetical protein
MQRSRAKLDALFAEGRVQDSQVMAAQELDEAGSDWTDERW